MEHISLPPFETLWLSAQFNVCHLFEYCHMGGELFFLNHFLVLGKDSMF